MVKEKTIFKEFMKKGVIPLIVIALVGTGLAKNLETKVRKSPRQRPLIEHNQEKTRPRVENNTQRIEPIDLSEINSYIERLKKEKKLFAYNLEKNLCATYALLAASDLYGKKFRWNDAWDMRYSNSVIAKIKNPKDLAELADKGTLKEGMIIGTFNPRSRYLGEKDKRGRPVKYTHLMLYIGKNNNGDLEFAHQFGPKIKKITLNQLHQKKLIPKEIIDSPI